MDLLLSDSKDKSINPQFPDFCGISLISSDRVNKVLFYSTSLTLNLAKFLVLCNLSDRNKVNFFLHPITQLLRVMSCVYFTFILQQPPTI